MIQTILFFTWRYIRGTRQTGALSTLVTICFCAILLGTFCLTVATAIMHGFKKATCTTLQSIHADLIMQPERSQQLHYEPIIKIITKEFPEVISYCPRASNYVILEKKSQEYRQQIIVTLQALEPDLEIRTTKLAETIQGKHPANLQVLLKPNTIIIGSKLASDLHINRGDVLTLHYAQDQETASSSLTFESSTVSVAAIFGTGIVDYDAAVIWGSFDLFKTLFDEEITSIGLKARENVDLQKISHSLEQRFGVSVQPWYNLYPALFQALQLEEYALLIVLFFIVILASLTMASTLILHIEHKRIDIALLQAIGMSSIAVRSIFLVLGLCIAGSATLCGMVAGCLASWIINTYKLISLPESYYTTYIPAQLPLWYFCILFIVSCSISTIVVWYGTRRSQTLSISSILRGQMH